MSGDAPAAPATRSGFRAEHLVAIVASALVVLAIGAGTSSLPHGTPIGTACVWHGSRLVVSGGVINTHMSSGRFQVTARVVIDGRPRTLRRSAFVDLSAFSAGRWSATYRYARKGLVGGGVAACTAHVVTIAPHSGEE